MYKTYHAILREKGLSEKQIKILAEIEDKVLLLAHKKNIAQRRYDRAMLRWQKLNKKYGV